MDPRRPAGAAPPRGHQLRIGAVEPYFGGSHRHFLSDLARHSRHRIELFTLPPRLWKWRVRGAALDIAPRLEAAAGERGFDLFLCSDFVNLPDLRALVGPALRAVPVLYYLHENQTTYPLSPDEEFDPYFGFTNVLSCLSAEGVAFNSEFHRRDFLARLPGFLPRLPDYEPRRVVETIAAKAEVLPVGLDVAELERLRPNPSSGPRDRGRPPRILWNHRWEFDKRPERFVAALERLAGDGVPFVADVVGESFARRPAIFDAARERLGERLGRFGYVESREEYVQLLWTADVAVSTANQEFFGIALAEATICGAHPIAPRALVYEDLYGGACERHHLYRDDDELVALLGRALAEPIPGHDCALAERLRGFDWASVAPRFDARFEALAAAARARAHSGA
jgi:glycosyltransferase involved in cell wall biosynthesis